MKNRIIITIILGVLLACTACGKTESITETEQTVVTENVETEATEAFVPETELETESTEATKAVESEADTESTEISETETTLIEDKASPKAETMSYTFTDMNTTMYAKSSVNVRSLPSTDGTRVGSLSTNQEVTVTGQCNETGWYRIQYNNSECYVSNKYLTEQKVATTSPKTESTNTASAGVDTAASTDPYIALMEAVIAQFGPNVIVYDNQTICDSRTGQQIGVISNGQIVAVNDGQTSAATTIADGFDRAAAEAIWSYMNAERTAAGLNEIAWDENVYNYSCQRAQAIVSDYSHNGNSYYAENINKCLIYSGDPYAIHMSWHNSSGHYNNYMKEGRTTGACAVYIYNGGVYAVENFTPQSGNTTREINGQTVDVTQAEAAAIDAGNTWTASNGIVLYIDAGGDVSCNAYGDEATAAILEYYSCH